MVDDVNCRKGYNPEKEKHCTKCYPTADHHEFHPIFFTPIPFYF